MRALLDINVLLALFDSDHVEHERAREWITAEIEARVGIVRDHAERIRSDHQPAPLSEPNCTESSDRPIGRCDPHETPRVLVVLGQACSTPKSWTALVCSEASKLPMCICLPWPPPTMASLSPSIDRFRSAQCPARSRQTLSCSDKGHHLGSTPVAQVFVQSARTPVAAKRSSMSQNAFTTYRNSSCSGPSGLTATNTSLWLAPAFLP